MTKIVFFGTSDYVVCVPEALKKAGHEIVAIVTQSPKPVGREQLVTPSPVEEWAKKNGIKVLYEPQVNTSADIGVVASYGAIIKNEVINSFPQGILNIHPSLLPKYRGACPIQAAIFYNESQTGVTIIKMDERMDHGPIVTQETVAIEVSDNFETLRIKAFELGIKMLVEILPNYLNGEIKLFPQDEGKVTYTWKAAETKSKAYFHIDNLPNPDTLERMARAFYPWPNAWTRWGGKIVKFYPGRKIQMEGKNPVKFEEFLRAYPNFPIKPQQLQPAFRSFSTSADI